MYRTVLVPLDGSRFAEHALPMAMGIARRARARLLLAHVRQPATIDGLTSFYLVGGPGDGDAERAYLRGAHERVAVAVGAATDSILLDGPVSDALHELAVRAAADLVVMATHGHGPLSRFWLGSIADQLVRRLPMPLLLQRPEEGAVDLTREPALHQILVPLDGSERAEKALAPATALGALWGAQYVLTRVLSPVPIVGWDLAGYSTGALDLPEMERRQAEAHAYLDKVAARLRARSLRVRTSVLVHKHAAVGLLEDAQTQGADLIALATRGRGGFKRLLLGSVADKVVRGASTPVLVFRPLGTEE